MASGQRYVQLFIESARGVLPGAWDADELIEHHERLHPEIRRARRPAPRVRDRPISRACSTTPVNRTGPRNGAVGDRTRPARRAHQPLRSAHRRPPRSMPWAATPIRARGTAAQGLRIAHDEGLTATCCHFVFVAAALAAQRDDIEPAAVLLAAAARYADPLGVGGTGTQSRLSGRSPNRGRRPPRRPHRRPTAWRGDDDRGPHHLHPRHPHLKQRRVARTSIAMTTRPTRQSTP